MCTVSFYKNQHQTIITSNRDEQTSRPLALAPQKVISGHSAAYYPIDPQSQGTWFAVKEDGSVYVLLNGAAKKHVRNPPYRKSRGLILLELINTAYFFETWNHIDFSNIEPFTIVAFVDNQLAQMRWDGSEKSHLFLDTNKAHIWSSATLYEDAVVQKRKEWFSTFLNQRKKPIQATDLIDFHTQTEKKDTQNGLIINRNQTMLTKNVTQCAIENNQFTLTHFDLLTAKKTNITTFIS